MAKNCIKMFENAQKLTKSFKNWSKSVSKNQKNRIYLGSLMVNLKKQSQFVIQRRMSRIIRKEYSYVVKVADSQSSLVNSQLNISL